MTIDLAAYSADLCKAAPEVRATLEASFADAARVMSPAGLTRYLDGARALCELGRGNDVVVTYLQEMPQVARECGEDLVGDCLNAALKLSSMTSGAVIALFLASLPAAARRLGDPDLLRGYLALIHQIAAKAPRGLRPMLGLIDELLSKLTLSGLRRWASYGAEAHRRDLVTLAKYFALETADARSVLQKERRGTLFVAAQRKLNFYLRALWGRDFFLRPAAAESDAFRPFIEDNVFYLPDAVDPLGAHSGHDLFRAMAAHLAAHVAARDPGGLSAEALSPAQMAFIGLIEDARVEYRATLLFPGLKPLWRSLIEDALTTGEAAHPTTALLERLALALMEPCLLTGDDDLDAIADAFHAAIEARAEDASLSYDLGLDLYSRLAARRVVPSLRLIEAARLPYRDDNRFIWAMGETDWDAGEAYVPASQRQVRRTANVLEMVNELDCELAGDDAQEIWRLTTPFWLDQEACTINELEGTEPVSEPFPYHEWDYQVQLFKPDWATVTERRQPKGDPAEIDRILADYKPVTARIRQIIDMLQPAGVQRQRNLEDGDEIDLNAAVDAMVAIRMGSQPNTRITMRTVVKTRDLAVLVLLDLSESTNDPIADMEGKTVLDLTREAAALVATAISGIGDPFAIHGFSSDSRHDVRYFRFKDFGERFDEAARARLAGMQGGYSTRMGAAMRHAGRHLAAQPQRRKLLLVVTDGAPADIDERDPHTLRHDAAKAAEELHAGGIMSYCLTLDPRADDYVRRIFGQNNYTIIDHVRRLPEKLPTLFASLTR